MDGEVEREARGRGVNILEMCIFLSLQADETAKVLCQNDTGGFERRKKKLERNMQNKLREERKAVRGVVKRGGGGESERGS